MIHIKLKLLDEKFSIHRFNELNEIPSQIFQSSFFNITRTKEEVSIVCPSFLKLNSEQCNKDWGCIKVMGQLDFGLTGILANLSRVLAKAQISIFSLSTYDTDYILVKSVKVKKAMAALESAGYKFI